MNATNSLKSLAHTCLLRTCLYECFSNEAQCFGIGDEGQRQIAGIGNWIGNGSVLVLVLFNLGDDRVIRHKAIFSSTQPDNCHHIHSGKEQDKSVPLFTATTVRGVNV